MIDILCDHGKVVIPVLLTATTSTGLVALWWIRRYIADQDDWRREILKKLDEALDEHDECQKKLPEKFVAKSDFMQFMQMRSTEHGLINNRLLALENQQAALIAKIDVFMDDIKLKQQRLSDTFLAKEHEISKRIDNLVDSHRVSAGNGQ